MKKILLIFICSFLILIVFTGCDKRKLLDEKSVFNYLNDIYPNESFEIISKKEIDIRHDNCGDEKVEGYSWLVKSNDTNIEFNVKDDYYFLL